MRAIPTMLTILLALSLPSALAAEADGQTREWGGLIGAGPEEALLRFGSPEEIFIYRGGMSREESVVFFREGIYLFWYENRVWQLRADRNAEISLGDVAVGESRAQVEARLGAPLAEVEGSLVYELENYAYPVRLRILFDSAGRVDDIYLYRSDY